MIRSTLNGIHWLCLILSALFATQAFADGQFNLNLGLDLPEKSDTFKTNTGMARLQLQGKPRLFTLEGGFQFDYGASLYAGEFAAGLKSYPFWKMSDDFRAQPFLGVEGLGFAGSRNSVTAVDPGVGFFGGADFRLGSTWGTTFEAEFANYPQQRSVRIWVGLFSEAFSAI